MMRARILVVDDKENLLKLFEKILSEPYELTTAGDGAAALERISLETFDVIVSDIRMPGADGFEVLRAAKAKSPDTEVILMTAYASVQKAVEAIREGAYDYLTKPFDPDEVGLVVARALERKRLKEQTATLRRELQEVFGFETLVGKSPAMRNVYGLVARAAELDITVLITGETGTGKELVARAIHHHGSRAGGAFVAVNCGALPADLMESELFGHSRGAFTGAVEAKAGLFEQAVRGTLFLDEIGELPLGLQVKLNRALQLKEIRRVGETVDRKVDVRVVSATHRDLRAEAKAGRFREDLFYRLNVFPIELPALRERREDIPLLATHFLERFSRQYGQPVEGFEPGALDALSRYPWPGNVRELENALERAVALGSGTRLTLQALPTEIARASAATGSPVTEMLAKISYRQAVEEGRDRVSHDYLVALLHEFRGNVTHAAERAGMERESLHRLLKRYGLRSDDFKT